MDHKEIIKSIRQKQFKPVYFLHGEEPFFIDAITEVIENEILGEAEKGFNQTILYGKETTVQHIVDNATRYPMMSQYQVVVVKELQEMDIFKRSKDNDDLKRLQNYVEHPLSSTILLLAHKHKKLDLRTAFAKTLVKNAVVFESKPLYENQVPDFIRNWLKDNKLGIESDALNLVVEYLGTDLGKIINELEKLKLNVALGSNISTAHIEQFVGINREYNVFELQKALAQRNILQANKIVNFFDKNPKEAPFVLVISNLYNFFSKLYQYYFVQNQNTNEQVKTLGLRSDWFLKEYQSAIRLYPRSKVEDIIGALSEYDLKSKGVNADGVEEGALLKELIYKILH